MNECASQTAVVEADELARTVARVAVQDGWEAGASVLSTHWDRYALSHPDAVLDSIKALPGEALVQLPSLLIAANYLQHVLSGGDPRRFHDVAYDDVGRSARERNSLDELIAAAGRSAGHRTAGRLYLAHKSAVEGRRALDGVPEPERPELRVALPHLLTQWGRSFEMVDAGGIHEYEEAWDLANLTDQPLIARRAAASLAWLHADHGWLNDADVWIRRAEQLGVVSTRYDAPLHLAAALVAIDRLDGDAAEAHLDSLGSVQSGEYWSAELWVRAWAARSVQETWLVEQRIENEVRRHPERTVTEGVHRRYMIASRARLAAMRDAPFAPEPKPDDPVPFDQIMSAAAAYRGGRLHAVLKHAEPIIRPGAGPRTRACGLLLTAAARHRLGRIDSAFDAFLGAHDIIAHEGLFSAYSILVAEDLDALEKLTGLQGVASVQRKEASRDAQQSDVVALSSLTRREREILIKLASDQRVTMIAQELFISPNTVKSISRSLYRKLGVHSRTQAANVAHRAGLA